MCLSLCCYCSIQPSASLSIYPLASSLLALCVPVNSNAMLFASNPFSFIFPAILPSELAVTMSFVLLELSRVFLAIRPYQVTLSMHFIVQPVSLVLLAVRPCVNAVPTDLIHFENPVIHRPICESQLALPVFLALEVLSLIHCAIRPGLNTEPMLLVILPVPLVSGPISVSVGAFAVGFIVFPFAFVNITVCV